MARDTGADHVARMHAVAEDAVLAQASVEFVCEQNVAQFRAVVREKPVVVGFDRTQL